MTGLLHRLAARANGTAWAVRSDARLPFGADTLLPESESIPKAQEVQVPAAAPAATASMAAPMETAPPVLQHPRTDMPAMPAMPLAASALPSRPTLPQHPAPALESHPASPPSLLPPVPVQPASADALAAGTALQQRCTPNATNAHSHPAQSTETTHSTLKTPTVCHSGWNTASDDAVQPHAVPHWQSSEPAPLLPPVGADASSSGMGTPRQLAVLRAMGAAQQNQPSQDTEVHIHIGRIDVTAVHEKPQPKARARERTQPVSLDAYLAARSSK